MEITTIGLDLAKNVFQVHGVNERGKAVLRRQLKRMLLYCKQVLQLVTSDLNLSASRLSRTF